MVKTSNFTMSRDAKAKWLKALRGGRYKQTQHDLADHKGYCCLGVLMRTQGVPRSKLLNRGLPEDTAKGAKWKVGVYNVRFGDLMVSLVTLNDREKLTFAQIADLIEKKVPCHGN